jgi:hypothetical protein
MTPDPDLVARRAQIIAEIQESIAQLDRGEFVTEDQLRARFASERAARLSNRLMPVDNQSVEADPLLPRKLDLSKAVRGKYYDRMQEGTNIVLLAPDLMEAFPDSEAVNDALRKYQALTAAKRA